ncbi:hypothetical protein CYMTET_8055, partial [Cymbomonas tetramitiformis]
VPAGREEVPTRGRITASRAISPPAPAHKLGLPGQYYGCMYDRDGKGGFYPLEGAWGFHNYAERQVEGFLACVSRSTAAACARSLYGTHQQLVKGLYSLFLPDWLEEFPRQQLHVIRLESYSSDLRSHMQQVFEYLKLQKPENETGWEPYISEERQNKGGAITRGCGANEDGMLNQTRDMLRQFYHPYDTVLSKLLKVSPSMIKISQIAPG